MLRMYICSIVHTASMHMGMGLWVERVRPRWASVVSDTGICALQTGRHLSDTWTAATSS